MHFLKQSFLQVAFIVSMNCLLTSPALAIHKPLYSNYGKLPFQGRTTDRSNNQSTQWAVVRISSYTPNYGMVPIVVSDTGISGMGYIDNSSALGIWVGNTSPIITFTPDQSIAIGTDNAQGYRLAVNGNALFTKVKVKLFGSWPDYVFKPSYQLPSLLQVEQFIKEHQHLPGIPSAFEMEQKGLDVGDNQALLLQKIEELTLYLIQATKAIEQLKIENQKLMLQRTTLQDLQQQITELKAALK